MAVRWANGGRLGGIGRGVDPRTWLAGAIAVTGACLLVWEWSAGRPLWVDEEMLALNVRHRALVDLAGPLGLDQSAPLGWLALQRLVVLALGTGERALRLLPLLFGLATLACAVAIGRRWLGIAGAVVFAWLCTFASSLAYHALEFKQYSADAFWGLAIPALGAWVLDAGDAGRARRRAIAWWLVAAVAQWFGNGALLVAPACALLLLAVLWRRHGVRVAAAVVAGGVVWLAAFGLHDFLSLRYASGSAHLQAYWNFALAPAHGGPAAVLRWLSAAILPFAVKPLGTSHPLAFWLVAAAGVIVAIRARPAAGVLLALVPLSAVAWAILRLVPLYERLSLWIVPSVYLAVAVAADGAAWLARRGTRLPWAPVRVAALAVACAGMVTVGVLGADAFGNSRALLFERPSDDYHRLDDRDGVRWLAKQREPGDVFATTRLGLPAVWWYGGLSPWPTGSGREAARAVPVFEVRWMPGGGDCSPSVLAAKLGHPRRVLLHLGFRLDDWPPPREEVLLSSLAAIGEITRFRAFAEAGGAVVFDLSRPPAAGSQLPPRPWVPEGVRPAPARGCIDVVPARAW